MISNANKFVGSASSSGVFINEDGNLVNNASTLRHDEGKAYDSALMRVAQSRLVISEVFRRSGLVSSTGGLGTILSIYERVGEMTAAKVSMDGHTRSEQDALTFDEIAVPVPIFHKEFFVNNRHLLASRQGPGSDIETSNIEAATRVVAEEWEDHLVNGVPSISVGGNPIYGLATHPDRMTETISNSWASATGAQIVTNVKSAIQKAYNKNFYGPFTLFVSGAAWANLQDDYSDSKGDNTILDRILQFREIASVEVAQSLATGDFLLVNMDSGTVDIKMAQDMDYVEWTTQPFASEFKVFTAGVIRVKSDRNAACGIVHGSE